MHASPLINNHPGTPPPARALPPGGWPSEKEMAAMDDAEASLGDDALFVPNGGSDGGSKRGGGGDGMERGGSSYASR